MRQLAIAIYLEALFQMDFGEISDFYKLFPGCRKEWLKRTPKEMLKIPNYLTYGDCL